jgi:hypothetical protein
MMKTTSRVCLLALAAASALSACGGGDIEDLLNVADPKVRFVHAAASAPNLTLSRNDEARAGATDVPYQTASGYADVSNGGADWRVRTANGAVELDKTSLDIHRGDRYTFLALPTATAGGASLFSVRDPYSQPLVATPQVGRLRVVNGAPGGKAFDVYVTSSSADLDDVSATLRDTGYRESRPRSGEDSLTLVSKNYRLRLTETGTRNVLFDADLDMADRSDRLLVAVPSPAGDSRPLRVLVVGINSHEDAEPTKELTSR